MRDAEAMTVWSRRALATGGGLAILVVAVVLYNGWLWLTQGTPTIPTLTGQWWAGYYDTPASGRLWCVGRFAASPSGRLEMILLSPSGKPDVFDVDRSSTNETFVYLTFTQPQTSIHIEAKQLYAGERYYLGRLMAGRFGDFWKMNDDITIRGHFLPETPQREFAIEPISDGALNNFWERDVRPHQPIPGPADILKAAGVLN
jgi:hypothetical protein